MSDTLQQLTTLCAQMRDAEAEVVSAENALKERKAELFSLATEDIPGLMAELGVKKIQLETGQRIEVKDDVSASIPEANKEAAFTWLEENDFGSIIKVEVAVQFGKDQRDEALALYTKLAEEGLQPTMKRGVHASTLKSFLKERIAEGSPIPLELFGAMAYSIAKIK